MLVGVLGLVWALTLVLPELRGLGIWPRTMRGLVGILAAPLLHANLAHLTANALPLLVLLTLLFWDKHYHPERTLALVWLAAGLGTWLIGRGHAVHIGASGLVYGLVTYLVVSGFLMKSWRSAFVALLVFLFYGGIVYGMLPQRGLISWEGHLCGALAGLWAARRNHTR
ncbi:MAG: rhomboid family intramembrane serine protease [Verrucomicrobia bacterium]|nr:rhomboid family intramembrane serine protease [Verrucomicrobiota bacterium]